VPGLLLPQAVHFALRANCVKGRVVTVSESEAVTVPATALGFDTGTEATPGSHEHLLDVTAAHGNPLTLLRSIWAHRHLAFILARKDFFVRYRRATLGVLWAVGMPFIQAMVLTLVFSVIVKLPAPDNVSRSVFIFSAIIAFNYFNITVMQASTSIVDGSGMSSRIYFPRAVLPLMAVCANAYALLASLVVLLILTVSLGTPIDAHILLLVPAMLLLVLFTLSLGLVLSALHVFFRDIRYIVQATLLALFYVTPIFYSLTPVKSGGRLSVIQPHGIVRDLILVNPLAGIVEFFRASIGAADSVWPVAVAITAGWTVVLLIVGLVLHSRWDRLFVDLL
jgi:ABC-type polysaccharide/polyol phosphate export permease